jgi:hypothetical protein
LAERDGRHRTCAQLRGGLAGLLELRAALGPLAASAEGQGGLQGRALPLRVAVRAGAGRVGQAVPPLSSSYAALSALWRAAAGESEAVEALGGLLAQGAAALGDFAEAAGLLGQGAPLPAGQTWGGRLGGSFAEFAAASAGRLALLPEIPSADAMQL